MRAAIWAYNHADWYVDSVLLRAREIAAAPADLIGSLTGLAEGRFPIPEHARSADDLPERQLLERRSIAIFARYGAPVVAANDGVVEQVGRCKPTRPLHQDPGRLRQPLHLRAPGIDSRSPGAGVTGGGRRCGRPRRRDPARHSGPSQLHDPSGRSRRAADRPQPILEGWKLLEATASTASGENVLGGGASIGQILLLPKPLLEERVLADERIEIYSCGRDDIRSGRSTGACWPLSRTWPSPASARRSLRSRAAMAITRARETSRTTRPATPSTSR